MGTHVRGGTDDKNTQREMRPRPNSTPSQVLRRRDNPRFLVRAESQQVFVARNQKIRLRNSSTFQKHIVVKPRDRNPGTKPRDRRDVPETQGNPGTDGTFPVDSRESYGSRNRPTLPSVPRLPSGGTPKKLPFSLRRITHRRRTIQISQ